MNSMNHLSEDDLALFALQLLEGGELENTLNHLERCEQCRQDVARFQGDLSLYAISQSDLHSPPAQARERLLRRVAKEKKVAPASVAAPVPPQRAPVASLPQYDRSSTAVPVAPANLPPLPPRFAGNPVANEENDVFLPARGRRMFGVEPEDVTEEDEQPERARGGLLLALGWTGWAIAAGMAVVAGLQFRERQSTQGELTAQQTQLQSAQSSLADVQSALDTLTDSNAMQVSLHIPINGQPMPPEPEGHAAYNPEKGSLVFIANHVKDIPANKTYELWVLPASGKEPVPAGTFRPDARGVASVIMPEIPKGIVAKGFGVTIEDQGGSKTPTPPIILAGL